MKASVETDTVKARDGRTLCVELGGDPKGTPVLVHGGTPNSRHLFTKWLDDAERRGLRLISYDRPGYGESTPCPRHTVADAAEDVRSIADALEIDRLLVWGYSGGGPYTLACAALLPDLVAAAATVGSVAPYGVPDLDYFAGMGESNVEGIQLYFSDPGACRKQGLEEREAMLQATPKQTAEILKTLLTPTDAAVLTGQFAAFLTNCTHDGLAPGDEGWWDDGVAHLGPWGFDLDSIRIPVKVWHGRQDRFVPFQHGQWLAEHVPGAQAALSEEDGHLTLLVEKIGAVHEWLLGEL
ncbi:MAG TPA: alpha/beta hydrolase [Candidatus Dormibacteraeota bacterium]|nr:alpha/beta hydrolase [Candidatus Dormibacteraeota bacterium]